MAKHIIKVEDRSLRHRSYHKINREDALKRLWITLVAILSRLTSPKHGMRLPPPVSL
jgi:hypothetical protein